MNAFKVGDRVSHPNFGEGVVVDISHRLIQVIFDSKESVMTSSNLLTHVRPPNPFNKGDIVTHRLHGTATVVDWEPSCKLVHIVPEAYGGDIVSVHPTSLELVKAPTYLVLVEEITGAGYAFGLTSTGVADFIANTVNWRVTEKITITKEGN